MVLHLSEKVKRYDNICEFIPAEVVFLLCLLKGNY